MLTIYSRSNTLTQSAKESLSSNLWVFPGELTQSLSALGGDFVRALNRSLERGISIYDLIKVSRYCNLSDRALRIIGLRSRSRLGEYICNDNQTYPLGINEAPTTRQEWVRSNFESMVGDLPTIVGNMIPQAVGFGCSVAEIVSDYSDRDGQQWRLSKLKILEIDRYEFAGYDGEIDRVIYRPLYGVPYPIPIAKLLVIYVPKIDNPNDLNGDSAIARAYPFYLARQLGYQAWSLAGQNQATGYPVYKARSEKNVQLLDSSGKAMRDEDGNVRVTNAVYALAEKLKNHRSGEAIVLDKDEEVTSLNPGSGDAFYNTFLTNLQKQIFICYGMPSTILDDTQSALGGVGINRNHMEILDSQIDGVMANTRSEIIEKVVRPLSIANFGIDIERNLGEFMLESGIDPTIAGIQTSNIMQGTMQGLLDPNDFEVVNTFRKLCGLQPETREAFDKRMELRYLQMQGQQG
jgi:hypothetical protein